MFEESKKICLKKLQEGRYIEVFRLQDIEDDFFHNYQRYDFYQIIWFCNVQGDNLYFLDFNEYRIHSGQLVIVYPGQIDKLDIRGKEGFLFAVHNESFFRLNQKINSSYLNGYDSNIFVDIPDDLNPVLTKLTDLIQQEYNEQNRIDLMEMYMEAFLFHISSLATQNKGNKKSPGDFIIAELMKLIDLFFIKERESCFYADRMGMSIKKLNDLCLKGTGKTVKQHLCERLVLEIKKEIGLGEKNLKEIAFDLGFNEPAYFTRFFKQNTGITPTQFRLSLENDTFRRDLEKSPSKR